MKHIHLDLHVNMHVIGTVIVSSLTVASIAVLEYVHLNSALAYEKQAVYAQFSDNNTSDEAKTPEKSEEVTQTKQNKWKMGAYSDEVSMNSADELSIETVMGKIKMKRAFNTILQDTTSSNFAEKIENLSGEQKIIVLERIENKMEELQSTDDNNGKIDKKLGHLLAAKDLFMNQ